MTKALSGKRVLVARPKAQAEETAALLRQRGAEPVVVPLIEVVAPPNIGLLSRAVRELSRYDVVVFTSANAVRAVIDEAWSQGLDLARALEGVCFASIGPGTTAALEARGIRPEIIADNHVGEGMAEAVLSAWKEGERAPRILLPRALVARDELPTMLREAGCSVEIVPAYETRKAPREAIDALSLELMRSAIDAVLLTSSSTVTSLCDALGERAAELLSHTVLATIGPIAEETAKARGLSVAVSADPYTVPALIDALERYFARASR